MHPRLVCLKSFLFVFSVSLFFIAAQVSAQTDTPYTEQNKLIRAPQAFTRLGADLFGDKVNLYTGSLEFIQTDVSIPGNNILPVSVGRRLVTGADAINGALFGRWDLEIPHLHGIFHDARLGNNRQHKSTLHRFQRPALCIDCWRRAVGLRRVLARQLFVRARLR